jgi:dihydrolipoamide dehydrogenase
LDVIIIGGGTAGINALQEARRYTDNVILINNGPLAASGAYHVSVQSNAFLNAVRLYAAQRKLARLGIEGGENVTVDVPRLMASARQAAEAAAQQLRVRLNGGSAYMIEGSAQFEGPTKIRAGGNLYHAKTVVLATGMQSYVPSYLQGYRERLLTAETLFKRQDLPHRIGVVGLGPSGLAMAQAFAELGSRVTSFDERHQLGGLVHGPLVERMHGHLSAAFPMYLGVRPTPRETTTGLKLRWNEDQFCAVDALYVSLGRRPVLDGLSLRRLEIPENDEGMPSYDARTLQLEGVPVYLTSDASDEHFTMHESRDEGVQAVRYALGVDTAPRAVPLPFSVCAGEVSLATVGDIASLLKRSDVSAFEARWEPDHLLAGGAPAVVRLYTRASDGVLLGAEIAAADASHLAQSVAVAVQRHLTARDLLEVPLQGAHTEELLRQVLVSASVPLRATKKHPSPGAFLHHAAS